MNGLLRQLMRISPLRRRRTLFSPTAAVWSFGRLTGGRHGRRRSGNVTASGDVWEVTRVTYPCLPVLTETRGAATDTRKLKVYEYIYVCLQFAEYVN